MIALVYMPFGSLHHPSLALGLLTAGLRRVGVPVTNHYGNLLFAQHIGLADYCALELSPSEGLLGEWVFAEAAFGERALPPELFCDWWEQRTGAKAYYTTLYRAQLVRQQVGGYLDLMTEQVLRTRPRLVGASSSFQQNCASLALLRRIKAADPSVLTMMGGANCEGPMGQTLVDQFPWLDYAVSGEADTLFVEFCQDLRAGRTPRVGPGLLRRHQAPVGSDRAAVADMTRVEVPDYDAYFETLDQMSFASNIDPGLVLEASRGCWWGQKHHCTFCGLNGGGMGYRTKPAERVLDEFATLSGRYGVRRFQLADNILDMGHLKTVLPVLAEREAPYNLFYETKSNLKRAQVELLAAAGVRWIQPGVESLHDEVLKLMDKGSTGLQNVQFLRRAREFGIRCSWNFLSGFPGEDPQWSADVAAWLPLIIHLQPPNGLHKVRYDRFSPYHEQADHYGLKMRPHAAYPLVYPLAEADLNQLAYFFEDQDPQLRTLEHPGYQALRAAIGDWQVAWQSVPPILSWEDDGQTLEILDTRPCSVERLTRWQGRERELLLACESPQTPATLARTLGPCDSECRELRRRGLLLQVGEKLLSLPVPGRVPTLPGRADFPGGTMVARRQTREYRGFPAATGGRSWT